MSFIRKVMNDSNELSHKYVILSIIHIILLIVADKKIHTLSIANVVSLLLPMIYFIYIRTNSGKRNFIMLNKVVSCLLIIGSVYFLYIFCMQIISELAMNFVSLYAVLYYIVTICSSVYWALVFLLPNHIKEQIFVNRKVNRIIYSILIVLSIFTFLMYSGIHINGDFYFEEVVLLILNMLLGTIESILQIRFVYLYQLFKEGKIKNV